MTKVALKIQPADGPHILVVDNDHCTCAALLAMLKRKGYDVLGAETFQAGHELLEQNHFDVILADICLGPQEDGLTLLEKSQSLYPDTPVILITGYPTVKTATTAVRLKAYDYLVKPLSMAELHKVVDRALELGRLKAEKRHIESENCRYQRNLEQLVAARTTQLQQANRCLEEQIEERFRAEEQILSQNAFLTSVIEALDHPFMVIDATDYHVRIANSAARRDKLAEASTCYQMYRGHDQPCQKLGYRCALNEVVTTRRPVSLEHIYVGQDGKEANVDIHAFPIFDMEGKVVQVIQYCVDITAKKRLESVAEAANLMENLGYIFSGLRHEIGNPINSVKMALSVLSMNLEDYPLDTIREFIDRALSEISRVEYLLKALKNYSLFESPRIEPVHVGRFMHNFLALVKKDFTAKGITVSFEAADGDLWIMADHRALHQVLLNLLTNAADALINRPEPRIIISAAANCRLVRLAMSDNGCGMSAEECGNLFKPFFTSKPTGTGLGLVIVKKMLAKMGSTIQIDSRPQEGTTVNMYLPQGFAQNESPQQTPADS